MRPEPEAVLSWRTADVPAGELPEGYFERPCAACGEPVALSPSSERPLAEGAMVVCKDCGLSAARERSEAGWPVRVAITPEQHAELRSLGWTDAEIGMAAVFAQAQLDGRL